MSGLESTGSIMAESCDSLMPPTPNRPVQDILFLRPLDEPDPLKKVPNLWSGQGNQVSLFLGEAGL
jgi:hypothetical protein